MQHDSVLSSHLSTLQALKEQVSSDPEASQLISAMIERTNKLMLQFEGVKKHIVSFCILRLFCWGDGC